MYPATSKCNIETLRYTLYTVHTYICTYVPKLYIICTIIYSFIGGNWISLVIGGGGWEVRVKVNLTRRMDTGEINTSPISAITPIIRLQHGCNHTIKIPGGLYNYICKQAAYGDHYIYICTYILHELYIRPQFIHIQHHTDLVSTLYYYNTL